MLSCRCTSDRGIESYLFCTSSWMTSVSGRITFYEHEVPLILISGTNVCKLILPSFCDMAIWVIQLAIKSAGKAVL